MSTRANHFKIGLFVISTVALLILCIAALGAKALFQKTVLMETYIDESVQGLDIGSPIKYRGVQIGNVKEITFVSKRYQTQYAYVMVRATMDPDTFGRKLSGEFGDTLKSEIGRGLRVRLASQGLTGTAYLEADYVDARRNPALPIDWAPDTHYIPSAPSTITRVTQSVDQVFRRLENTNIEKVVENLDRFLIVLTQTVEAADVEGVRRETVALLEETRGIVHRARELVENPELDTVPGDVAALTAQLRRTVEQSARETTPLLANMRESSAHIAGITSQLNEFLGGEDFEKGLADLVEITAKVRTASENLPQTLLSLNRATRRLDTLISNQQQNLQAILDSTRQITRNLAELTDYGKKYPAHVLFGEPPPPSEPTR